LLLCYEISTDYVTTALGCDSPYTCNKLTKGTTAPCAPSISRHAALPPARFPIAQAHWSYTKQSHINSTEYEYFSLLVIDTFGKNWHDNVYFS